MEKGRGVKARLALVLATVIWGSSFLVMKNTLDHIPTFALLAIRFTGACLLLGAAFWKKVRAATKRDLTQGFIMGTLLFTAYSVQTFGLTDTTPGKNAFLTATYCIFVPFLGWLLTKRRPDRYNLCAAILCIVGVGCVSLTGDFSVRMGDLLSMACGLFYALHILATARFTGRGDAFLLTVLQFFFAALWAWAFALGTGGLPDGIPVDSLFSLGYLCVFATGVCLLLQSYGQKYTPPTTVALLLSLEAVFGVVFSLLFGGGEELSVRMVLGFLLIFCSIVVSETKLSFFGKK